MRVMTGSEAQLASIKILALEIRLAAFRSIQFATNEINSVDSVMH